MKLLIVDDDRMLVEYLEVVLQQDGYTVDVARDVREGRERAAGGDYDALILDVMLPDGTGFGLLRELRASGVEAPILMLTSRDREEDVIQGLDGGADDYLKKPVQAGELCARVRAMLRRTRSAPSEEVTRGGLTLDRLGHSVSCDGKKLRLTPREFALLEYLMLHPGGTITRTELLDKVWDIRFDPGSNVVDTHIARLRAKLEKAGAHARIVTVRGTGFELV